MTHYIYDKAKYHEDVVQQYGLTREHTTNHTIFFLRWLIEHNMVSAAFEKEMHKMISQYKNRIFTIYDIYEWWDCCLSNEMLSNEGNAFAKAYFDFEQGQYIHDYSKTLQQNLPTVFHIDYTEENYQKIKHLINCRYIEWKKEEMLKNVLTGNMNLIKNYNNKNSYRNPYNLNVIITPADVKQILMKYLNGQITAEELQKWADFFQYQSNDIFSTPYNNEDFYEDMRDVMLMISTPGFNGAITPEKVKEYLKILEKYKEM